MEEELSDGQEVLQQKYLDFQTSTQQLKQIEEHLQKLEAQLSELRSIEEAIKELGAVQAGSEILVPIANGIFANATITNTHEFLVNVGAGTTVQKDASGVMSLLRVWQRCG